MSSPFCRIMFGWTPRCSRGACVKASCKGHKGSHEIELSFSKNINYTKICEDRDVMERLLRRFMHERTVSGTNFVYYVPSSLGTYVLHCTTE
eukprot:6195298-Pleurochrysis_carterae.AAC.4